MADGSGAPVTHTVCAYCGVGCGIAAGVKDVDARLITIAGDPAHPANGGRLCSKGTALNETLGLAGRLLRPHINGREAFWGEALDTIAAQIARVRNAHGPDAIGFYVSGQLLTEDYYVANKLVKGFLGTANIDTNSRLCMASTVVAQQRAFGEDVVPGCYEDLELADLVVLVGSNTAWCHPVLFQRIKAAQAARGTKVVVIDPRRTATCEIADLHLAIRPGTDAALFNGLLVYLAEQGALDASFIAQHTAGYGGALNAARSDTASSDANSIDALAARCGITREALLTFFNAFAHTPKTVTCWSQGVNQSTGGTDKVNAIINCHLATGRIGKPGAGPLSLTGQPNAMGGREVGGLATQLAAHIGFDDATARAQVAQFWRSTTLPAKRGLKAVELFEAVARGEVKFLWIIGTNPAASLPNAERVRQAIAACEFVVVSDCVADNDTLRHAHVALPAQAWGEKDGTVTNSERRISRQRALVPAAGETKPDWWALAQVARRLGYAAQFPYTNAAEIFREHAALSALGNGGKKSQRLFDLGGLAGLTDEQYAALAPVQWPVRPGRMAPGGEKYSPADSARLFADGRFMHADHRARFIAIATHRPAHAPHHDAPLLLNTARLRDQWHTMTRTGIVPRLVRHTDEPELEINPQDAQALGVVERSFVTVASAQGRALLRARITDHVRAGEVCAPMHWTRTIAPSSCVNALVNADTDPQSGQPEFKHTPVRVTPWVAAVEAVLLVRAPLAMPQADYVVRTQEDGCVRLRLAQGERPASLLAWAQEKLAAALGSEFQGQWMSREDPAAGRAALACFVDGALIAFGAVQCGGAPQHIDWLRRLVAQGALDDAQRMWLLAGLLPPGEQPCSRQVCACLQVSERTLQEAVRNGCSTVTALMAATRAGSQCGTCIPELGAFVAPQPATAPQPTTVASLTLLVP